MEDKRVVGSLIWFPIFLLRWVTSVISPPCSYERTACLCLLYYLKGKSNVLDLYPCLLLLMVCSGISDYFYPFGPRVVVSCLVIWSGSPSVGIEWLFLGTWFYSPETETKDKLKKWSYQVQLGKPKNLQMLFTGACVRVFLQNLGDLGSSFPVQKAHPEYPKGASLEFLDQFSSGYTK